MAVVLKMLGPLSVNLQKKYAQVVPELIKKDVQELDNKYNLITEK